MESENKSFIEVDSDSHFPIQNLPFGIFTHPRSLNPRVGVAIGNLVLDLAELEKRGILSDFQYDESIFSSASLNGLMRQGRDTWSRLRKRLIELLSAEGDEIRDNQELRDAVLLPQSECKMQLPVEVPDYTDFYSARHHATNVGTMLRGAENALQPNWLHLPVAYHGRSSSLIPTDIDVHRPHGQLAENKYGPSRAIDFELEMGFFVGTETTLGEPIAISNAADHIFGMVLVNDWSARDIQKWEYVPLGPFLAKNFATSISPWVVTTEALAPFQQPLPKQDPPAMPYLSWQQDYTYDIDLRVSLNPANTDHVLEVTRSNFQYLYWSIHQQLAHHTVNGCNVRVGDLLASGTISGPDKSSRGCLLELSWRGAEPLELPDGDKRIFLEDGDRVTMTGWCQGSDYRVGFGEVTAKLLPARAEG